LQRSSQQATALALAGEASKLCSSAASINKENKASFVKLESTDKGTMGAKKRRRACRFPRGEKSRPREEASRGGRPWKEFRYAYGWTIGVVLPASAGSVLCFG
jgi:hypothetical protein